MHCKVICLIICFGIFLLLPTVSAEFTGFYSLLQQYLGYFGIRNSSYSAQYLSPAELGQSHGQSHYNYKIVLLEPYRHFCEPDDKSIMHLAHLMRAKKIPHPRPPLMVKCLQSVPDNESMHNGTTQLLMMENIKDILNLLKPIGNATKRHEPGNCVIVHFCTATALGCATAAPLVNELPYYFPTLRIAHIDTTRFAHFNAEFGIVGIPTLMLFHQGRAILKYYSEENTYIAFITRHTGIKPVKPTIDLDKISGPLPSELVYERDYCLTLAWVFFILCGLNRFRHTAFWEATVELVKRNWREAEMMENA